MLAGTRLLKTCAALALAASLAACIAVPVVDQAEPACQTYTRSMSLKTVGMNNVNCRDEACLAGVLAISAGSVLISGSIVLTGNTIHWLEYQGTCSDSYLNIAKQRFLDAINGPKPAPKS